MRIAATPGTANTTATYNKMGGDYNATYDIWLARPPAPTSAYSDALDGFVMVWLYKPGSRSPIGPPPALHGRCALCTASRPCRVRTHHENVVSQQRSAPGQP